MLRLGLGVGLGFGVGAIGATLLACGRGGGAGRAGETDTDSESVAVALPEDVTPPPEPAVATAKAFPAGRTERAMLSGSWWETRLYVLSSGVAGPVVFVLGGVHGDEPGAWVAADEIATWTPRTGTLLVIPRANVEAIAEGVRTTSALGDLNRLYPGNPKSKLPMARMAAEIVAVAKEFRTQLLYDMHESWEFYAERPQNGNAFLGQTVSAGVGPQSPAAARALTARANQRISVKRDRMYARSEVPPPTVKQTNSLGVGIWVDGLTSLLVEMGQDRQEEARRTELHLLVARTFLESRGML